MVPSQAQIELQPGHCRSGWRLCSNEDDQMYDFCQLNRAPHVSGVIS
jgi:hypothetical protein